MSFLEMGGSGLVLFFVLKTKKHYGKEGKSNKYVHSDKINISRRRRCADENATVFSTSRESRIKLMS